VRILLTGGGEGAALIAARLIREGNQVTIIEQDRARCQELEEHLDAKIVRGNAGSIRTLRKAGLADAEMLIAETSSDEVNLLSCMIAQANSSAKVKVARIRTHEFQQWEHILSRMGLRVDRIIHPETSIMRRIMRVLHLPGVSDIIDFADGQVKLFGMNVDRNSWFADKTVEELDAAGPPKDSLIAMIFRGPQVIIPHGAQRLEPGDHIYICTTRENLEAVFEFMGIEARRAVRRVVIVGGHQLGIWVAQELQRAGVSVKLIERDPQRCELISNILDKTLVIHGDGTDQQTLEEENIYGADAFLALTKDDADNIVASLLARRLGAHKIVALINRLNYLPIVQRLGINTAISQRLTAVDMILRYVRKGRVLSVTTFREEEAEAIELIATKGSRIIDRKLRDIRFPHGAIVGAIKRPNGFVCVPRGNVAVHEGDQVIFFTLERAVPELESAFLEQPRRRKSAA
jgi:trk system potassium uptake protein TrkA